MNEAIAKIVASVTDNPHDKFKWSEWAEILQSEGVKIMNDASGKSPDEIVMSKDAATLIRQECICELVSVDEPKIAADEEDLKKAKEAKQLQVTGLIDGEYAEKELAGPPAPATVKTFPAVVGASPRVVSVAQHIHVQEWRKQFAAYRERIPLGETIYGQDGDKIRIDTVYNPGKPPHMTTRIYLSNLVGELCWYGQRINDMKVRGWRILILPKSRDIALQHFDILEDYGLVTSVRIVNASSTHEDTLLGEILEF